MQTLFVSDEGPWGRTGGSKRLALMCQILAGFGPLDLLLIPPGARAHRPSRPPKLPMRDSRYLIGGVDEADPDARFFRAVHVITRDALKNEHSTSPNHSVHEAIESEIICTQAGLVQPLAEYISNRAYDLVWYNRERNWLLTKGMVDKSAASSIVDIDDLEDMVLSRWLDIEKNEHGGPLTESERRRMEADITFWRQVHQRVASEADSLLFSSKKDHSRMRFGNSVVVPNTYMSPSASEGLQRIPAGPKILFQGWLRWPANEDAAAWLAEEIAPGIRKHVPEVQIILAGDASARVREMSMIPGVHVMGEVPNMSPYLRAAHVVAVPLRVGGGTRIKILEAFAHRVPVVATNIGAEGIDATPGVHLELADTTADIVRHCVRLLTSAPAREQMASAAFRLYDDRYRPIHAEEAVQRALRMAIERRSVR